MEEFIGAVFAFTLAVGAAIGFLATNPTAIKGGSCILYRSEVYCRQAVGK